MNELPIENIPMKMKNLEFSSNCIVCYLHFQSRAAYLIHPLEGYCRHTKKNFNGIPYFGKSKFWAILIAVTNLATVMVSFNILRTSWGQCDEINTRCFVSLNWISIVIVADIMNKCCSINFNSRLDELNGLANIFENRKYYGITNLICYTCGRNLVKNQKRFVMAVFSVGFISGITTDILNDGSWQRHEIVSIYASISSQLFVLFSIRYKLFILMKVYLSVSRHLMKIMDRIQVDKNFSYRLELKKILHLYLELLKFHQRLNDFLNPTLLVWIGSTSFMTVVNTYIAITMIKTKITFEFFYAALGTSVSFIIMDYIMTTNEKFAQQSRPILRYLFKYKISRLEYEEAIKVEMLILNLIELKPVTEASDMFAVGTKLLPSIFGFVTTFVLVAIQFKAVWQEGDESM